MATTGQGFLGCNMFAYCCNNPVTREDPDGAAFDTVIDILSLGSSIADVISNPNDPWAWAGLAGDVIDVAVPFVTGVGEVTRAAKVAKETAEVVDDAHDAMKVVSNMADVLPGACFIAGTLVSVEDGHKAIEDVEAGDYVWAWDEETGEVALKRVVETYVRASNELIHIFVNGEEIITTPDHPFYVPVKGWTDAANLRAGDILVLVNGEYVIVEKVQHEILEAPVTVYNFQVEDFHTYFVAASAVLVHNSGCAQPFRFNDDQQAVLQLAKEYKHGLTAEEAEILVDWAEEYGIYFHRPMTHPERGGYWKDKLHIGIMKWHIEIIDS